MARTFRFSIAGLFVLILFAAVTIRLWPIPKRKPKWDRQTIGSTQINAFYAWYDNAQFKVRKIYDGTWRQDRLIQGTGKCIWILHSVSGIEPTIGGCGSYNQIGIQHPSRTQTGDVFEIKILASDRNSNTVNMHDEPLSYLNDCEATVFRFCDPDIDSLSDDDYDRLGTVKIIEKTANYVKIKLDLIDDAMMGGYKHGIPRVLKLQRLTPRSPE